MRQRIASLSCLVVLVLSGLDAQGQEFARMLRNGETATLSVYGPRPVDLAAKKLVNEFSIRINVEDPLYFHRDDLRTSGPVQASGHSSHGGRFSKSI
jgi:hypothetical protein